MIQQDTDLVLVNEDLAHNRVYSAGSGKPIVFLHGPFGQEWNAFLADLASDRKVISPEIPGADKQHDLEILTTQWDLLMYYDDLFDKLGLDEFDLVGHSFGGMIAAEYAATFRNRVRKLVLIDPMGLWLDENPVGDFVNGSPDVLQAQMWANGAPEEADVYRLRSDIDQDEAVEEALRKMFSVAAAANFAHPIPDRGLNRRLHRITAPTQLIWGDKDGFVPPVYADRFRSLIPNVELQIVTDAAHHPHIERTAEVLDLIRAFLAG